MWWNSIKNKYTYLLLSKGSFTPVRNLISFVKGFSQDHFCQPTQSFSLSFVWEFKQFVGSGRQKLRKPIQIQEIDRTERRKIYQNLPWRKYVQHLTSKLVNLIVTHDAIVTKVKIEAFKKSFRKKSQNIIYLSGMFWNALWVLARTWRSPLSP
jgi:hypothetical protein